MRLAAALGLLAIAALATGGLASLTAGDRGEADEQTDARSRGRATPAGTEHLIDPASLVEARVDEAEQAVIRARAALRSARQLGVVDRDRLDVLERQLDAAIGRRPSASAAPPTPTPMTPVKPTSPRAKPDAGPRSL